ncbi:hypothetical protein O7634_05545 [Micromonospora sp. WMMD1120]|uniref:hypothetical protein n=1 Tax=Micromonospora sp. WMMD1120 TaxID=3016106 RepID=UPI002416E9BA|nr:hypothetical protein [Micromonospora sp. WMMD1120]MDG4806218.1 hypothetical protein [Micromonospora sp. WMMD1120]
MPVPGRARRLNCTSLPSSHGHAIALAFYLAANMRDAVDDLYSLGVRPDLRALHARFLGWLSLTRGPRRADLG